MTNASIVDYRLIIARRYLISRKQVSLISIITGISVAGVSLGVAALIVVLSVMNGFYDFVRDLLVSVDPHVRIVSAEARGLSRSDSLLQVVLSHPHVVSASPYVEGKALLLHEGNGGSNRVVIVRGVDQETLSGVSKVTTQTDFGSFELERRDGRPGIVLGMSLGQRLALIPGNSDREPSRVSLLSAPAIVRMYTGVMGTPPLTRFDVRGLFELENVYDDTHVFISLTEAQRLFRLDDRISGIELRLDDIGLAQRVKEDLQIRLDSNRFTVLTWYDLQKSLYDVMQLEKWGASAILVLIIVVAAFNIVGSLTMIVIEKRRDVGVLQAMGVSRKHVRHIFLLEGLLVGGIGTGIGLFTGLILSLLQKYFELVPLAQAESFMINAYPVSIQWLDLVLIGTVSLGLCLLAAFYPAARAAAIEPARAVHVEG